MAQQPFHERIQRFMCSHSLALVSLCVGNVSLCVLDDSTDLLQDKLRQVWPRLDYVLWYPFCLLFQLHIVFLRYRGLFGDFVYFGVGFASSRL